MTQKDKNISTADKELEQLMNENSEANSFQESPNMTIDDDIDWEKELLADGDGDSIERAEDDADVSELQKDIDPSQTETPLEEEEFGFDDDDLYHELLETDLTSEQNSTETEADQLDSELLTDMDDPQGKNHNQQDATVELDVESDEHEEEISLKEKIQGYFEAVVDKARANPAQGIVYGITGLLCVFFLYQSIGLIQGIIGVTQNPGITAQEDYLSNLDSGMNIPTEPLPIETLPTERSPKPEPIGETARAEPATEIVPPVTLNPPTVKAIQDSGSANIPTSQLTSAPKVTPQPSQADIQAEIDRRVAERMASIQLQQPTAKQQPVSDREMIDKNVQTIIKLGTRMQGYEQLMNSMQQTLTSIKTEQRLVRQQLESNNTAITQQQKSLEELADTLVQLRRNGAQAPSRDSYVSRRPSATVDPKPTQPTYEVIAASPESIIIRSKKTGKPVTISVGTNLIGYGKVTAVNGFGQILTVSGPVKTK